MSERIRLYRKAKRVGGLKFTNKRYPQGSARDWLIASNKAIKAKRVKNRQPQILTNVFDDDSNFRKINKSLKKGKIFQSDDAALGKIKIIGLKKDDIFSGTVDVNVVYEDVSKEEFRSDTLQSFRVQEANRNDLIQIVDGLVDDKFVEYGVAETYMRMIKTNIILIQNRRIQGAIRKMKVKAINFMKLNLKIESNNDVIPEGENCFVHYVQKNYGKQKRFIKNVSNMNTNKVWNVEECIKFLEDCNIPYYSYLGNLKLYKYKVDRKSKAKIFRFIFSNEHIYPVTKKELNALKCIKMDDYKIKGIKYIKKLTEFVFMQSNKGKALEKYKVKFDGESYIFSRVLIDNILYVNDLNVVKSYELFSKIMNFFPLAFNYSIYTPLIYICEKEKLYSSFNYDMKMNEAPYYYNPESMEKKNLICIDKNKSFSYALMSLKYIPVLDSQCFPEKYNKDDKFDVNNIYHVKKVTKDCRCFLSAGKMSGYRLKNFMDCVEIDYVIKPKLVPNPFSEIIKKMYYDDVELTKNILNVFYGVCRINKNSDYNLHSRITNNFQEAVEFGNFREIKCGDTEMYTLIESVEYKYKYKSNLMPISMFILDSAVNTLVEKIDELKKLDPKMKIAKIKTDSITVVTDVIKYDDLDLDKNDISKWKFEPVKKSGAKFICTNTLDDDEYMFEFDELLKSDAYSLPIEISKESARNELDKNIIYDCLAGSGKTYECLHAIIPELKDKKILIISSQHCSLEEYYLKKYNAKVIQHFTFSGHGMLEFRKYDTIIVDEFGKLEPPHIEYIFKHIGRNTNLIMLGDKGQLLPYGYNRSKPSPIENYEVYKLFDYVVKMEKNYRNEYTKEEYQKMKDLLFKLTGYEKSLIGKIGKLNITVTRTTMDKINNIKIKDWTDKYTFEDRTMKVKIGGKVISEFRSRNTLTLHKMRIYNGVFYTIKKYDDETITLTDKHNNDYTIPTELFVENFNYGYAITAFRAQGRSIPYNDIGIHDIRIIKKDGRMFYTVFSRILDRE